MSDQPKIVIAGGGVAGLEAIIALRSFAGDRVAITLLEPAEEFVYTPMSVVQPFAGTSAERRPLAAIASEFDVELVHEPLARVRSEDHVAVTADGTEYPYDVLLLALGGRRRPAFKHAVTFRGPEDDEAVHGLVQDVEGGYVRSIAFVVPGGITWPLPLYELALMLATRARDMNMDAELVFITPEDAPLGVLGEQASSGVARTLEEAGIRVETSAFADIEEHGKIFTRPDHKQFEVDRVVAMPVMDGPAVVGIDCDEHGFIPVDEHGRVAGADDVYAAGDGIDFPIKQGGIATQQADVVAADIARRVGVETGVDPDRPIVRVKLLTGHGARYSADESKLSQHALWWPPGKIAGAYLAPYLAGMELEPPPDRDVHDLEIPLGGAP